MNQTYLSKLDHKLLNRLHARDQFVMENEFKNVLSKSGVLGAHQEKSINHVSLPSSPLDRIEYETSELMMKEVEEFFHKMQTHLPIPEGNLQTAQRPRNLKESKNRRMLVKTPMQRSARQTHSTKS